MMCNHDLVIKDASGEHNSYKVTECKLCGVITNVVIRGDKSISADDLMKECLIKAQAWCADLDLTNWTSEDIAYIAMTRWMHHKNNLK